MEDRTIRLDRLSENAGVWTELQFKAPSSTDGIFCRRRLVLPGFARACYYAPFQKHAIDPRLDLWPEGYNQCHPLPLIDLRHAKRGGVFLLLQLADGDYLALLPAVSTQTMAWFRGDEEGFFVEAGHWGTGGWQGDLPLFGWARDANPYRACETVWRTTLAHPQISPLARMRSEKQYPAIFTHLGWCSWEEYKWDIREQLLLDVIELIDQSPVPIRWLLIDDGHVDGGAASSLNLQNGEVPANEAEQRLRSFSVLRDRFPHGWERIMAAREGTKIRWLGLWLNFNGYWGGIHAQNALGALNEALMQVGPNTLQPRPDAGSANRFYKAFVEEQSRAGFDFIKVDNQAKNVTFYRDRVPNAVAATMHNHAGLEDAVGTQLQGMINCMAHNNLGAFSTRHSQITRCSEDYKKGDLWRGKHHLNNSFANMLWMGQTVWGDHDMFHSRDALAGEVMARSKAISGGPIYLSDAPQHLDAKQIMPLCWEDGRLLQPLAPAVPLPESLFIDTYEDSRAYRVIAPLAHGCAAVAAYNLTDPEKIVTGSLGAEDYRWAGAMLQDNAPEWPLPPEGLMAYDLKSRRIHPMRRPIGFTIDKFGDEFFLLCPIRAGWVIIGRDDKYLPPQAVLSFQAMPDRLSVTLVEEGPFLFWSERGEPRFPQEPSALASLGEGLWRVDLPVKPGICSIEIFR